MKIYCISGLGADKRAFQYLSISHHELVHVEWIEPDKKDTIETYAKKLSKQIDNNEPYLLMGLSFGGIIACELAKILGQKKVIHISSINNKQDLPIVFRWIGRVGILKLIPANWLRPPMPLAYWFFGVKKKQNKLLLKEILKDTDQAFLKWAMNRLLSKEVIHEPESLVRIHGTMDRLLSCSKDERVFKIEGGGHFMIVEQAKEVSQVLSEFLLQEKSKNGGKGINH